eukprot:3518960-Amphidinium_carterae.2
MADPWVNYPYIRVIRAWFTLHVWQYHESYALNLSRPQQHTDALNLCAWYARVGWQFVELYSHAELTAPWERE